MDLIKARNVREFVREKGREGKHTTFLASYNMWDIEQVWDIINGGKIVFDGSIRDPNRMNYNFSNL